MENFSNIDKNLIENWLEEEKNTSYSRLELFSYTWKV